MMCKLCEYGVSTKVLYGNLRILGLHEKTIGFREFFIECETIDNDVDIPMERFTVVLSDGRKGTVLVSKIIGYNPQRVSLSGEGELE